MKKTLHSRRLVLASALALGVVRPSEAAPVGSAPPAWIERSNENARIVIESQARFTPEAFGQFGVAGLDEKVFDLGPRLTERTIAASEKTLDELRRRLAAEKDPRVREDLAILIEQQEESIEGARLAEKHTLPYFDLAQTEFRGIRSLLDDQIPAERRAKALVRLRKYAGLEPGTTSIAKLAEARIRERLGVPGVQMPFKDKVEKDLGNADSFVEGIGKLFEKYGVAGSAEPLAKLKEQLAAYQDFVRREILSKARTDFRQPPEIYAYSLKTVGIDMPVDELTSRARVAFREIQNELQALAPLVAKARGFSSTDYRDVIRELKKEQIPGDRIQAFYEERIRQVERLITANRVLTLPERAMRIRVASAAESAATPAPNMRPPRLIGNTGEMGEFVLPMRVPGKAGEGEVGFDDFTFDAAAWTLTAHEGRPGHELQFASMMERGVSTARALFAFNSVNVEGWALYAEAEMKPYLPLEGQLIALQHRLVRAARAFLDPGLQAGTITREEATRILSKDVVLSDAMTASEVERYTFRSPGQAPSYFCGYLRLMELRTDTERILGSRFERAKYHDFLLAQGLLPPALLRRAVMEEFVPKQRAAGG